MKALQDKRVLMAGAVAGGLLLAWMAAGSARRLAQSTASAAVGMAEGTFTGVIIGVGEVIGVPETSPDQCSADIAAGRTWDSSFSCPAGRFLKSLFN